MTALIVISLTPAAYRWLVTTTSARVLNSFERACNLINQDGAVLSLVTSARGLTPFAMVVAAEVQSPFELVTPQSEVRVGTGQLVIGPLHIGIESASLWDPVPDWLALRRDFAESPARLAELVRMVLELAPPNSLVDLYRPPSSSVSGASAESLSPALLARAGQGAADLVQGVWVGSTERYLAGARRLAGLGTGLTPAGDDFIGGVILAAWAGLYGVGREQVGEVIVEAAVPLTTTLSAAYLRAAAQGECIAAWHTLFAALLGSDREVIRMAVKSLMSIGHTSGADALAGFIAVSQRAAHSQK